MLVSLVLYGSRARGDHRQKSDVDLLGVVEQGPIRNELSAGGTSVYRYPYELLLNNSRRGDLFVLHLVREGIVLHDSLGLFAAVQKEFEFRTYYSDVISDAYFVTKFFQTRPVLLKQKMARKRLVWATRTILIARAAEQKLALFSSDALARFSGLSGLKKAIDDRNLVDHGELLTLAIKIADRYGATDESSLWPEAKEDQRALMRGRNGLVADTLKFIQPRRTIKFRNAVPPRVVSTPSDYI